MDFQFSLFHYLLKLLFWHVLHLPDATMLGLVKSCIGTKFTGQFGDLIAVRISLIGYSLCVLILF